MVRLCLEPACPNPVTRGRRCRTHARNHDRGYNRGYNRAGYHIYRSKRWKAARKRQLFDHPLCAECGRVATDVHHIQDIAAGGAPYDPANLASLCRPCHSKITRARTSP